MDQQEPDNSVTDLGASSPPALPHRFGGGLSADIDAAARIVHFLYAEARQLDEERYADWFAGLDDAIRYRAPMRTNLAREDLADEFPELGAAVFDDRKRDLAQRIDRLTGGFAPSEDPAPRYIRQVSNVEVYLGPDEGTFEVFSVVILHRSRAFSHTEPLVYRRSDILILSKLGVALRDRTIWLLQADIRQGALPTLL